MDDKHRHKDPCHKNCKTKEALLRSIYNNLVRLNISENDALDLLKTITDLQTNISQSVDNISNTVKGIC